jgi:hypothetical protein
MAATAFELFNKAKYHIGATVNLTTASHFRVVLLEGYTKDLTDETWVDVKATEVATGSGYTAGGYEITQTWTESSGTVTFNSDDPTWTVVDPGPLVARHAVLVHDADGNGTLADTDKLIAVALIDSADVSVNSGNPFILQIAGTGYFSFAGGTNA